MNTLIRASIIAAIATACCGPVAIAADEPTTPTTDQQQAATDQDDTTKCGAASIAGDFGFQAQGTRNQGRRQQNFYVVRTASFDGQNKTVGKGMANVAGRLLPYSIEGTYTVGADCSVTIDATQTFGDGKPEPYKQFGVLVNGGDEIMVIQTNMTGGRSQIGRYEKY